VKGVFHYYLNATEMSDLRQAGRLPAFFSLAFGISILSLAAIPPFPGFMENGPF
jgi:formate hydrogenlyase subunit 3/multisubunit Na+/H+ antiporter MnhD subunit